MHDIEKLLAEELRSDDGVPPLDAGRLLAGVQRHRRRRAAALTSVAIVLAGAVTAVVLRVPGFGQADGLAPAGEDQAGTAVASIRALAFTPDSRGYVIASQCGRKERCTFRLGVSADGGTRWTWRPFPADAGEDDYRVVAFESGPVIVTAQSPDKRRRWLSTDEGRTWTSAPADAQPPTDAPASGSALTFGCSPGCAEYGPVLDLPDGTVHQVVKGVAPGLAKGDRAVIGTPRPRLASDGSIWTPVTTSTSNVDALPESIAISRDGGRTWRKTLTNTGRSLMVATQNGQTAFVRGESQDNKVMLFRTGDGGGTWRPFPPPREIAATERVTIEVGADGRLLVHDAATGALYRYTADGSAYERVAGVPKFAALVRLGPADLIGYPDRTGPFYASHDGVHWRKLGL